MTYLQDATYSNDLIGTSSSGVSQMIYGMPWEDQSYEDTDTLLVRPELSESVNTTIGLDAQFNLLFDAMDIFHADVITRMTPWKNTLRLLRQAEPIVSYIITTEPQKFVETSTWLDTTQTFWSDGFTSVNIEQEEFYKQIIQYWQKREILDRFDVLAQRKDNWDGYDSKKPTQSTLDYAKHLIEELYDYITSAGHSWLTPFISSDEDGYITAAWNKGKRALHIEIEENGAEYTKIWRTNINMKMEIDFLNRDDYLTLWEWLLDE